jgi:hypothetical protein
LLIAIFLSYSKNLDVVLSTIWYVAQMKHEESNGEQSCQNCH